MMRDPVAQKMVNVRPIPTNIMTPPSIEVGEIQTPSERPTRVAGHVPEHRQEELRTRQYMAKKLRGEREGVGDILRRYFSPGTPSDPVSSGILDATPSTVFQEGPLTGRTPEEREIAYWTAKRRGDELQDVGAGQFLPGAVGSSLRQRQISGEDEDAGLYPARGTNPELQARQFMAEYLPSERVGYGHILRNLFGGRNRFDERGVGADTLGYYDALRNQQNKRTFLGQLARNMGFI